MAKNIDYYKEIEKLLEVTPKHIYVAFAVSCARDQLHNIKDENTYKQCEDALNVVERFNKGQATQAEVEAAYSAANAASSAAYAASSATHAAHCAANNAAYSAARSAAYAAYAAHSAANNAANNAAYSAARSAAYAAYAAHSAANRAARSAAYSDKMKQYYKVLQEMLTKLTLIEKIVYNITEEVVCK
jgi:hypothetical protein